MAHSPHTLLTRREREIMDAVFTLGNRASAEQIRECLIHPPTDSAVRAMLARLEKKGISNISTMVPVLFIRRASHQVLPNGTQ